MTEAFNFGCQFDGFTVKKNTAEVYKVRGEGTFAPWGLFMVYEKAGALTVISDHGNWGHAWPQPGESFKKFLIGLDSSYFFGKVHGRPDRFNLEQTLRDWKMEVIKDRNLRELDQEKAREVYDAIDDFYRRSDCSNPDQLYISLQDDKILSDYFS